MRYQSLARRSALHSVASAFVLLVAACAAPGGTLPRPEPGSLVLGRTTIAETIARFGEPQKRTKLSGVPSTPNAQGVVPTASAGTLENIVYLYAPDGANSRLVWGYFRRLSMSFLNDRLVGYAYVSNFLNDNVGFDERKVSSFVEGKTTRSDILRELGRPSGESIYPVGAYNRRSALFYSHISFSRSADYSGSTAESSSKSVRFFFDGSEMLTGTYKTDQTVQTGLNDRPGT